MEDSVTITVAGNAWVEIATGPAEFNISSDQQMFYCYHTTTVDPTNIRGHFLIADESLVINLPAGMGVWVRNGASSNINGTMLVTISESAVV